MALEFLLNPEPTFEWPVPVPVAGKVEPVMVRMSFKHRTKDELDKFMKERGGKSDADSFMEMVSGWELSDEFTRPNVEKLLQNRAGTALSAYREYIEQLVKAKAKN